MFYSVCVPAVLGRCEIGEALSVIHSAGFSNYEIWSWWDKDVDAYAEAQKREQLAITALCTKMVPLTDPARRKEYVDGLRETAEVCHRLGCKTIISQVGQEMKELTRCEQHASIVEGLKASLPILKEHDLVLVIEPLNTRINHPGYYLWSAEEAFAIVDEVGDPHVKVLYDLYHQYVMDDLDLDVILNNIEKVGHFHMAGYPGRHEPLIESEIDYPSILKAIAQSGYEGAVGLEYFPVGDPGRGLQILSGQLKSI